MAAEWVGGVVLVVIMSVLVRLTYPRRLVKDARQKAAQSSPIHEHSMSKMSDDSFWRRIFSAETRVAVAQSFAMDWSMLWKDLIAGFLIAGFLSEFMPSAFWQTVFVTHARPSIQMPLDAAIGPLIAVISFVCSIGNVPMAAILWASGISFGGVLSFLYADLIVLPLLDVYRRYFGWKMAAYISVVFYITMVLTGVLMDIAFTSLHIVPRPSPNIRAELSQFSFNYTFWLNLIFGALAIYLLWHANAKSVHAQRNVCEHHVRPER